MMGIVPTRVENVNVLRAWVRVNVLPPEVAMDQVRRDSPMVFIQAGVQLYLKSIP